MKLNKFVLSGLSAASLALTFSACNSATNTTANNANIANKSNVAMVVNTNQTAKSDPTPAANTVNAVKPVNTAKATPEDSDSEKVSGELQVGKTDSVILYVGEETGDYAAYCFTNDSEAGRAILAACKNKEQCEFNGAIIDDMKCEVPGLEANLSASFKIMKVASVKSLGRRK